TARTPGGGRTVRDPHRLRRRRRPGPGPAAFDRLRHERPARGDGVRRLRRTGDRHGTARHRGRPGPDGEARQPDRQALLTRAAAPPARWSRGRVTRMRLVTLLIVGTVAAPPLPRT